MIPSQKCFDLVKSFESCRLVAFQDERGVWTLGWGRTLGVKEGDTCTQAEADADLEHDIQTKAVNVTDSIGAAPTTQNQFDAMVSFTYNIGAGGFLGSSVLTYHKQSDSAHAAASFLLWDKVEVNGQLVVSAGLLRRRQTESLLYLSREVIT